MLPPNGRRRTKPDLCGNAARTEVLPHISCWLAGWHVGDQMYASAYPDSAIATQLAGQHCLLYVASTLVMKERGRGREREREEK